MAAVAVAATFAAAQAVPATAADPVPPFITPSAPWLTTVNYYRAMAGLAPVVENTTWSAGAYNHSCYMLYNGISHDEIPGRTGYTTNGDAAGNAGNVAVSSAYGTTDRSHVELWMTGPFHAIGILRHNLQSVGYGKCDLNNTPTWHSGATLNVLSGLGSSPRPSTPILFPGNGTTTNLSQFITESPNPLTFCGYSGPAGLPVIAMMPEPVTSMSAGIMGPNGPVEMCPLFSGNTTGTAQSILGGDNAVTVVPRAPLTPGLYTVTVNTQARSVTWSFTVDPTASTGVMPIPTVTPAGPASDYTPVPPFRFADSRSSLRITRLLAGVPKRIKVTGVAGIPADATAISANFTVSAPTSASYLTVYNCATTAPTASTLNFNAYETVANAGIFPLAATGDICVWSPAETNLIIDVTGYFRAADSNGYHATTSIPLIDTTSQLNAGGRMTAGQTIQVDVVGSNPGVPDGATAVAVNIAGIMPSATNYVTAYPCDIARPLVSNVNPLVGTTKSNFAIVPVSATGTICFYAVAAVDLKVDLQGYFTGGGTGTIVPTAPTRVTDTRDVYRSAMNLGTGGAMLPANTTKTLVLAGQRGIPGTAKAVSLNVTVVKPTTNGTIVVWNCGAQPPVTSITYVAGKTVASGVQVDLSDAGAICVKASAGTHLVIDVNGWWN